MSSIRFVSFNKTRQVFRVHRFAFASDQFVQRPDRPTPLDLCLELGPPETILSQRFMFSAKLLIPFRVLSLDRADHAAAHITIVVTARYQNYFQTIRLQIKQVFTR